MTEKDTVAGMAPIREPFIERMDADSDLPSTQSGYDEELQRYTKSLTSSMTDYRWEFGRRYHAQDKQANYPLPNDEIESDRLDLHHKIYELTMFGALYFAPVHEPKRILDLGTGTGIWAIEMADKFPDAQVIGNDLSPIQPRWVPPNIHFEVDDMEQEWVYHEKFDFIHSRALHNSIQDWPKLIGRIFNQLEPGGWAEFVDYDVQWYSPDGSFPPESTLATVVRLFAAASRESGLEPSPGPQQERWMREAGFEEIHVTRLPIPVGTWPADRHLKELGAWNFVNFYEHLESFITYLFTRSYNYTKQDCDALAALSRKQMRDPKMHAFHNLYVTYGRRPGGAAPAPPPTPLPTG